MQAYRKLTADIPYNLLTDMLNKLNSREIGKGEHEKKIKWHFKGIHMPTVSKMGPTRNPSSSLHKIMAPTKMDDDNNRSHFNVAMQVPFAIP